MILAQLKDEDIYQQQPFYAYVLDNQGKKIMVKVSVDDCGFLMLTPQTPRGNNEEIIAKS